MSDYSAALSELDVVKRFFNAVRDGNLELFKESAGKLSGGSDLATTVSDVKDANQRGALHFAAREGRVEICRYLLEVLKLDVDVKDADGDTPLIHAARQGQARTAEYLLQHGARVSESGAMEATALHHSAGRGDVELLGLLLSRGADVESLSEMGTPLTWACGNRQHAAVLVLLRSGARVDAESDEGVTPLLSAVAAGSMECIRSLIEAGAAVNAMVGGVTPLHVASDMCGLEVVRFLLESGADPNATAEGGEKAVQAAAGSSNRDVVELLFPLTSPPADGAVPDWTVDGLLRRGATTDREPNEAFISTGEASAGAVDGAAAEAKKRGDEAFKRKEYAEAVEAYTQAIDLDPGRGALFSNRSLCWMRVGQADRALSDARECRSLCPRWSKACYREGASLRLLQRFDEAATAFYEGVQLDPENMELVSAFREAVEAGKNFHSQNKQGGNADEVCQSPIL